MVIRLLSTAVLSLALANTAFAETVEDMTRGRCFHECGARANSCKREACIGLGFGRPGSCEISSNRERIEYYRRIKVCENNHKTCEKSCR